MWFPISRDPPEGGTSLFHSGGHWFSVFPISRDPPEGGTSNFVLITATSKMVFPISRDPPEGGTYGLNVRHRRLLLVSNF